MYSYHYLILAYCPFWICPIKDKPCISSVMALFGISLSRNTMSLTVPAKPRYHRYYRNIKGLTPYHSIKMTHINLCHQATNSRRAPMVLHSAFGITLAHHLTMVPYAVTAVTQFRCNAFLPRCQNSNPYFFPFLCWR